MERGRLHTSSCTESTHMQTDKLCTYMTQKCYPSCVHMPVLQDAPHWFACAHAGPHHCKHVVVEAAVHSCAGAALLICLLPQG